MSAPVFIPREVEDRLSWVALTEALAAGHALPRAEIGDTFLYREGDTLLSRAAWITGLGAAVKTAMVLPAGARRGEGRLDGAMCLLSEETGGLDAVVDFRLVTKWKTAGDSLLGALRLARPESARVLIVGAGTVARSLLEAYGAGFPGAEFEIWNRTPSAAERLAAGRRRTRAIGDLESAVARADIVACATMSASPVLRGEWLRPGQHVDLIGAYRPDMREADDTALRRARIFVDSTATTLDHIGELKDPLARGVIGRNDVIADFYDLDRFGRRSAEDITLFKNGGGAHLDLMTARYILSAWQG